MKHVEAWPSERMLLAVGLALGCQQPRSMCDLRQLVGPGTSQGAWAEDLTRSAESSTGRRDSWLTTKPALVGPWIAHAIDLRPHRAVPGFGSAK